MKHVGLALLCVSSAASVASVACAQRQDRAGFVGGCVEGQPCTPDPPIGGSDATTSDGATAGDGEAGEASIDDAGVAVRAFVHRRNALTSDVDLTLPDLVTTIVVRGPRRGGGTIDGIPQGDGSQLLANVQQTIDGFTWLELREPTGARAVRSIEGAFLRTGTATVHAPLYPAEASQATWNEVAIGAGPYPTAIAVSTVLVHVYGKDNRRLAGVRARKGPDLAAQGPFYDDGKGIASTPTATGALGTIVVLGIPTSSGTFPVTLEYAGTPRSTVSVPLASDAITHLDLALE